MARTNKDRKVYICTTPQPTDLNQAAYEALTWVEVSNVGAVGEAGTNTNIVSYDELSTDVTQKGKGISNAGDPTIECARNPTDPGQIALRAAAKTNFTYAFKFEDKDAPDASHTNSVYYNRGLVTGPTRPNGRNEDFILEVFTLALNQREIVVDPVSLVVGTNSALPSITGASLAQGATLTALEGTWTGNAAVQGALSRDYLGEFGTAISNGASAASGKLKELAGSFTNVEGAAGKAGRAAKDAAEGAKDPWNGLRNAVDRTKEAMSFARDLAGGFLSDLRSGLKQGEGFWASFKNAALNALDKIVDKLLNNVLDALFQVNTAGSGIGGGGGGIGGLLGGIFSIFGFARGGYTGRGGASEVAGVVHGGEYVFSKRATDRIGVGALEQLHRTAKGYANGGHVQPSMPRIQVPAHGNGSPREVIVRVVGEAGPMFIPTIQAESKDVAVQVTQAGIGQYDKQLNRTLGGKIANAQSRQL